MSEDTIIKYEPIETIRRFHESNAPIRCIVGPVGSGKTTGAAWEICYYIPYYLFKNYNIKKTRFVVVRNSYAELIDTTQKTIFEWFPFGTHLKQRQIYILRYPDDDIEVEIMFRSCDRPQDVKKFKSLEITGYWVDESIEVANEVKKMLKNRIGRFPKKSPARYGIETTNPPDVEHPTYSEFAWDTPPPGPVSSKKPKENHVGFWQPPSENIKNLRQNYYEDLATDYIDSPDWIDMYIKGKPGVMVVGKLVYANFKKEIHVAKEPLKWSGQTIYRGWDNSGNCPACVVTIVPTAQRMQVLKEFWTDKQDMVTFTNAVKTECNMLYPEAKYVDYADPAGENKFSTSNGDFTSNAQLMRDECGIDTIKSEQNPIMRYSSVALQLGKIDGMLIDPGCTRLINGFTGGYHYPEIGFSGNYGSKPVKNKYSHVHDALQYVVVKIFGSTMVNNYDRPPDVSRAMSMRPRNVMVA